MTFCIALAAAQSLQAQYSADVITYINTYKGVAMTEMERSGIPAAIILAQGIHESEAGTSELVKKSNNHFGIKCRDDWKGPSVTHDDDARGECFRSYASPEESYKDHSDFLRGSTRYASLFNYAPDDYEDWAYGLKKAGYATNVHYPQILIKLIRDYNLQQYTLIAMGRLKPSEELVLQIPGASGGRPEGGGMGSGSGTGGNGLAGGQAGTGDTTAVSYPEGEFMIDHTRVVFVRAGTSLLSVAIQYELPLTRLLEFNDLKDEDVLVKDQLLYLQHKRKAGATNQPIAGNKLRPR
jgi:hypothetical protein